jgi:hypothetical protein
VGAAMVVMGDFSAMYGSDLKPKTKNSFLSRLLV